MKRFVAIGMITGLLFGCFGKGNKGEGKQGVPLYSVVEHHPFVIIIPSYNNREWAEKNLRSVFEQKYDNYRVIYIDDASSDGTFEKVEELIAQFQQGHRVELIRNRSNKGALSNIFSAIHSCKEGEIVILCDGDDWLAHDRVLERLNEVYADPNVWLTYGSYLEYPTYSYTVANFAKPIPEITLSQGSIREHTKRHWSLSHLHTFYASLFKQILSHHLRYQGEYFDAAYDLALMLPMVEMAGKHIRFIDEVLYIYNRATPLNDHKVKGDRQRQLAQYILNLPPYHPIDTLAEKPPSFLSGKLGEQTFIKTSEDLKRVGQYAAIYKMAANQENPKEAIPQTLHFIWLGPKPFPQKSIKILQQWISLHPTWKVKFWTDYLKEAPDPRVQVCGFEEFPWEHIETLYHQSDNFGERSFLLRYAILLQEGGIYVDHDVECLRPFDSLQGGYDFFCGIDPPARSILSSSVNPSPHLIGSTPDHPVLHSAIDWLKKEWDRLEGQYPGKAPVETLNRVLHRSFQAFGVGINTGSCKEGRRDIIFPPDHFSSQNRETAQYAIHEHLGSWHRNTLAEQSKKELLLLQIANESHRTFFLILGVFVLSFTIGGVFVFRSVARTRKR